MTVFSSSLSSPRRKCSGRRPESGGRMFRTSGWTFSISQRDHTVGLAAYLLCELPGLVMYPT